MSDVNRTTASGGRAVETRRQMRDRLAAILATLSVPTPDTAPTVRERAGVARHLAKLLDDRAGEVHAGRMIALADLAEGHPEAALAGFLRILRQLDEADEGAGAAETLVAIARVRSMLGDPEEAHAALRDAQTRYAELHDADGLALAATARGNLFADAGDYVRALECHAEALKLREEHGDEEQIGVCTFDIAMIYAAIGEHSSAVDLLDRSCGLFERCGAYDLHARAGSALAALLVSEGRLEEALAASLHAIVLLEIMGDHDAIVETLMNIASIHERCGRVRDAVATIGKATALAERTGGPERVATTLSTPITQAAQQYEKALAAALTAKFATTFPGVTLPPSNMDNGYMGPYTSAAQGSTPPCIVSQVGMDFQNWGLPTDTNLPTEIA